MNRLASLSAALVAVLVAGNALAKLPALSDEAKAKAAEAAAKAAYGDKVAGFQLCKSQERVAAGYYAGAKKAGKDTKPATATPQCADPGPFVYTPPGSASAPAAVAAAMPAKPGAAAAAPKK